MSLSLFFPLTDVLPINYGLHQRMQTQTFVWASKHFSILAYVMKQMCKVMDPETALCSWLFYHTYIYIKKNSYVDLTLIPKKKKIGKSSEIDLLTSRY